MSSKSEVVHLLTDRKGEVIGVRCGKSGKGKATPKASAWASGVTCPDCIPLGQQYTIRMRLKLELTPEDEARLAAFLNVDNQASTD